MKWTDHSRGYPPATKASFRTGIPKIHHNKCGGRVFRNDPYTCLVCDQKWGQYQIDRFTDAEVECRFHLRGDRDMTGYTLVWKSDDAGKRKFTTLVPTAEAMSYERAP